MPVYELPLIEVKRDAVYLEFPGEARPVEGEVFLILRPLRGSREFPLACGAPRRIVAEVTIVSNGENNRVQVHVERGSIIRGVCAERKRSSAPAFLLDPVKAAPGRVFRLV